MKAADHQGAVPPSREERFEKIGGGLSGPPTEYIKFEENHIDNSIKASCIS
jgi:hypothetical protein